MQSLVVYKSSNFQAKIFKMISKINNTFKILDLKLKKKSYYQDQNFNHGPTYMNLWLANLSSGRKRMSWLFLSRFLFYGLHLSVRNYLPQKKLEF